MTGGNMAGVFLASVGNTGDTHEVDVTMNVVGVSRARDDRRCRAWGRGLGKEGMFVGVDEG